MTATTPWTVRPEDYGATPGRDATAAFRAMFAAINAACVPDTGSSVPVSTVEVLLTGRYTVSGTLMQQAPGRAQGLTIRGLGKRASEIVTSSADPMLVNRDRWMGVRIRDCSFRSTNPAGVFLTSWSTGGAQDWCFENVEWRGSWRYAIGLDGPAASNCNSEFGFNHCQVGGSYDIAWLWSGMTPSIPAQDQFLNYWLRDCKVEYTSGTALRFDRGGSIAISDGSWIITGKRSDGAASRFIQLGQPGQTHADSVQKLAVRDVRFELRDATHQVINSAWTGSQILFDGCDDTAQGFKPFSQQLVAHEYTDPGIVSYRNCSLVGKHAYHQTRAPGRQVVTYQSCTRKNNRTAASFLARTNAPNLPSPGIRVTHTTDGDGIT